MSDLKLIAAVGSVTARRAAILAAVAELPDEADDELEFVVPQMREFYSTPRAPATVTPAPVITPVTGHVRVRIAEPMRFVFEEA